MNIRQQFIESQKKYGRCKGGINGDPAKNYIRTWVFTKKIIGADNKNYRKEAIINVRSDGSINSSIYQYNKAK